MSERQPRVFVSLPFDRSYQLEPTHQKVWDTVEPVLRKLELVYFMRWALQPNSDEFDRAVDLADLLVADVSRKDPNVMFEIGLARGKRKPTLILANREEEFIPLDVAGLDLVIYDPKDPGEFEKDLVRKLSRYFPGRN